MGINRIDHQIKKSLGLCLELLLCHNVSFLCVFVLALATIEC